MNDRVPPNDLDAEAVVLSAILLSSEALDRVQGLLHVSHFYADANRRIYEAATQLQQTGRPVDVVSVAGVLRDHETLQQVGGTPYLAQLADATPAVANIEHHARRIRDKWRVRQIITAAQAVAAEGYGDIGEVEDWAMSVDQRLLDVTRMPEREERLMVLGDATAEAIRIVQERQQHDGILLTGVTTGLPTLDARIGGFEPKNNYVIAARPGIGKTAAATGFALACARGTKGAEHGDGVVFISVEMPREQLALRVLAQMARIDSVRFMRGKLKMDQWKEIMAAQERIQKLPVVIEDSSDHTPASIRAAFRMGRRRLEERFGRKLKVRMCIIDYLQLLNSHTETNNREQEISLISRASKALAKDENIAVLSLAQVNRDCEKRPDKRPQLSDLRESGSIEQDADVVIFIYRDDYYRQKNEARDNKAEFIVSKIRMLGSTGTIYCEFEPTTTTFYEEGDNPDFSQLKDIFDGYIPGTYGEDAPPSSHWLDELDP